MSAIIVANTLPAELVALSAEAVEQVGALTGRVADLAPIVDDATRAATDALLSDVIALSKQITAARLTLTRPIDALKKAAMEAERAATQPLEAAEAHLADRVLAWTRKEAARVAEAKRLAEVERQRLQAEEDARADAERARLLAAAQAAAVDPDAYPGDQAPVVEVAATVALPRAIPAAYVPPAAVSSSVRTAKVHTVEVIDAAAVPVELAGIVLRPIDTAAALRLLKQGAKIPGLALVESEGYARKGGRS